jgi:AcrR family transcriptional regulator
MIRDSSRTKEAILEAAENLLIEKGFQALTLDDIAERASVSKGGLLHHYPSKQSLILGLAEHMIVLHEQEINANLKEDSERPGAFTRAYLRANLACVDESSQVCAMLVAESRNIPPMIKLFQDYSARCQKRLENDGLDPTTASIVRYAAEGLRSAAKSGLPRPANYDQVFAHLMNLAGGHNHRISKKGHNEVLQSA